MEGGAEVADEGVDVDLLRARREVELPVPLERGDRVVGRVAGGDAARVERQSGGAEGVRTAALAFDWFGSTGMPLRPKRGLGLIGVSSGLGLS